MYDNDELKIADNKPDEVLFTATGCDCLTFYAGSNQLRSATGLCKLCLEEAIQWDDDDDE